MGLFSSRPHVQRALKRRDVPALVAALAYLSDPEIPAAAAAALDTLGWQPGDDEASAYYHIAKTEWAACEALGPVAARPGVRAVTVSRSREAARLVARTGEPAVAPLLEATLGTDAPEVAGRLLMHMGAGMVPAVAACLTSDRAPVRAQAARFLARYAPDEVYGVLPALAAAADDADAGVRRAAGETLAGLGWKSGTPPELAAQIRDLHTAPDRLARVAALNAIAEAGAAHPPVRGYLLDALRDPDLQADAAYQIRQRGWEDAVSAELRPHFWMGSREWQRFVELGDGGLSELELALAHRDAVVRQSAVQALSGIGTPAAIARLGRVLAEDGETSVRTYACAMLQHTRAELGMDGVRRALADGSAAVRAQAVQTLVHWARTDGSLDVVGLLSARLDDPAVEVRRAVCTSVRHLQPTAETEDRRRAEALLPMLTRALADEDLQTRQAALAAMAALCLEPAQLRPILDTAIQDPAVEIRHEAIRLAGTLPGVAGMPILVHGLQDSDDGVRYTTVCVLAQRGSSGDPLIEPLVDVLVKQPPRRVLAAQIMERVQAPWVPDRLVALLPLLPDDYNLAPILGHLEIDGHPQFPALLRRALQHGEPMTRRYAVGRLVLHERRETIPDIAACLGDADTGLGTEAVRALVRFGVDEVRAVVPALVPLLASPDSGLRAAAAEALSLVGRDAAPAFDALVALLESGNPGDLPERLHAVRALQAIGDSAAVPVLAGMVEDAGLNVRCAAVVALGHLGDSGLTPLLLPLLDAEIVPMQCAAAEALGALGDPAVGGRLYRLSLDPARDAALREQACSGLTALSAACPAVAARLALVNRLEPDVVQGYRNDPTGRSHDAALALLQEGAEVTDFFIGRLPMSTDAAWALGVQGGEDAFQALCRELRSGVTRRIVAAAEALGRIGDARARQLLQPLAYGGIREVEDAATAALDKLGVTLPREGGISVDRVDPYRQVKAMWARFDETRRNAVERERALTWQRAFVAAMPELTFASDQERGHAWAMLGTLVYYSLNPHKSAIDSPCPEAAACYRQCLRATPARQDIGAYLALVEAPEPAPAPAVDEAPTGAGPQRVDPVWVDRLITLAGQARAARSLDVGREEARYLGQVIHGAGGFELMREIAERAARQAREQGFRDALGYIERWWDGIGRWQA